MIRVNAAFDRVDQVESLRGRVKGATDLARLVKEQQLPQQTPAAFVLPGSLTGGAAALATGFFRQAFSETLSVVLVVRVADDPTGKRALDAMAPVITDVVTAITGWGPDDSPGVFVLVRGDVTGAEVGALIYQLDFRLDDQLRITT
ncbi:MAG: hypothetical protein KGJ57_18190 [Sphingomonadales bacterium]|nr:hypothetical protein [Sphingomonadales bacterium]MDE2171329.1 hypothetical protein [Sphingomonadales bacterium]